MKGYNSDYCGGGETDGSVNGEDFNSAGSNSVKQVDSVSITADLHSVPTTGTPNSASKNYINGKLDSERYYDGDGNAYLDTISHEVESNIAEGQGDFYSFHLAFSCLK